MKELSVRDARLRAKMTQDELATASGLDQTTISDLETGRNVNPRLDTIRRLAKALKIRPVQLRFEEPQPDATVDRGEDKVGQSSARHRERGA